jgi:cation diffusion facilitator family transporter
VLAMIALLIGYEAISRLFNPVPIRFAQAIPIASLGLAVNIASAWLLGGGEHHGHEHGAAHDRDESQRIDGDVILEIFEDGVFPRFRLRRESGAALSATSLATMRRDGTRQIFALADRGGFLESVDQVPEPHEFVAEVSIGGAVYSVVFEEHEHAHGAAARDNNLRAAIVHVMADAAVSVFVIVGLSLAWAFGWLWMDAAAGILGALVIASWSASLIRDTGAILLDVTPDRKMSTKIRAAIEEDGDRLTDLHLWRLGPGHLGAIVSVVTPTARSETFFRGKLSRFRSLSHVTIEIRQTA